DVMPAIFRCWGRTPNGIRTRVTAVKGRGPRPLDDGGSAARDVRDAQDLRKHTTLDRCRAKRLRVTWVTGAKWHTGAVIEMSGEEFENAVGDGLDLIPEELAQHIDNVVILIEDEPTAELGEADLLGLYEGTPLTERDEWWAAGSLPDRITIFRGPTLRMCTSPEEVVEEVAITVIHEIAHHFGIDDVRLHKRKSTRLNSS